ncbi:MAG TPA: hypothetical protein VGC41_00795, partial [Kofleriaceae bacterium]
ALKGYKTEIVELPLDQETFAYTQQLTKGAAGTPVVHKIEDVKPATGSAGSAAPVTHPDQVTEPEVKPPETHAPEQKPPETHEPKPAGGSDDDTPTLKSFGSDGK